MLKAYVRNICCDLLGSVYIYPDISRMGEPGKREIIFGAMKPTEDYLNFDLV